MAKDAWCWCNH